jgi:predicted RNA methylase
MTLARSEPSRHAACLLAAAKLIVPDILSGERVAPTKINLAMEHAFGAKNTHGVWTQRDSFIALEMATILVLRQRDGDEKSLEAFKALEHLARQLPTQTVRSEEQVALQHFSTPPALAWLLVALARINEADRVLEPSAGTGMLAAWAGQGRALHLNEIDPTRAQILRHLFPEAAVSQEDGAHIGQMQINPSVIVMNPPFARNAAGGEDQLTAARHLAAAVSALRPGGRLVAIMPDGFSNLGKNAEIFARALRGCSLIAHLRIPDAFRLHGTSIPIRLLAIDKVAGKITTAAVSYDQLADFLPVLASLPPREALTELAPTPKRPEAAKTVLPGSSMLKAFSLARTSPPAAAPQQAVDTGKGWGDVVYSQLATPSYRSGRRRLCPMALPEDPDRSRKRPPVGTGRVRRDGLGEPPGARRCPALAGVDAPEKVLSGPQLETLIHGLNAHEQDLPGRYTIPERGLDLVPTPEGEFYRRGFFLGDGTGAGKGRQLASFIMDQWLRGNRRHLWLSENAALQCDAVRDWEALGGMAPDIQAISRFKPEAQIRLEQGILFSSYATLRSAGGAKTRLQQILDWCGPDYDGLILLDEAHAMGGVAGGEGRFGTTKGSQQGIAGVELQNRLPRARVVYASATGATDINNLAYAVRLGLWGEGTQFPDRRSFTERIREGGIAAMELVARELKAMGVYTARSLSYAGVEYDILEHALTPSQIADFDAYSQAWTIIHTNMQEALESSGVVDSLTSNTLNSQALAGAKSRFEGSRQRFLVSSCSR